MAQTSVHFEPVKACSEQHNRREKVLDYVHQEHSHLNERWERATISEMRHAAEERYFATVGQKMQKKATPIREGVVVIKPDTTMSDLRVFADRLQQHFGIRIFQIHMHKDEGHVNKVTGVLKKNLHAHIVADWTDEKTGKSLKLGKEDMAEMQTIAAETLGMERGVQSTKRGLSAIEYKVACREQELVAVGKVIGEVESAVAGMVEMQRELDHQHIPLALTDAAQRRHKMSLLNRLELWAGNSVELRNFTTHDKMLRPVVYVGKNDKKQLRVYTAKPSITEEQQQKNRQEVVSKLNELTEASTKTTAEANGSVAGALGGLLDGLLTTDIGVSSPNNALTKEKKRKKKPLRL